MSIVPKIYMHSLYNPYFSCPTQRMTFPHYLSKRMVSHTLMSHKGSYCSGLTHSQTQWVCRPESHFLLGEVSHCNKAGRGSQGRISTPGRDKWSVGFFHMLTPCYSSILHSARIQSSSAPNSLQRMFCFSGLATESPQFCGFAPQSQALWLSVEAFLICKSLYHPLIRVNALQKVY